MRWLSGLVVALSMFAVEPAKAQVADQLAAIPLGQAPVALTGLSAGLHEFVFIHPYTCCPVKVCVCLPCGCYDIYCKECFGTKLKFDYPGLFGDVVIKFHKDGTVSVKDAS